MPVEVVSGDVKQRRSVRPDLLGEVQLVARQLYDEHLGLWLEKYGFSHGYPDVSHGHTRVSRPIEDRLHHLNRRRLPVRARHGEPRDGFRPQLPRELLPTPDQRGTGMANPGVVRW